MPLEMMGSSVSDYQRWFTSSIICLLITNLGLSIGEKVAHKSSPLTLTSMNLG
jgi:hypothetical protein